MLNSSNNENQSNANSSTDLNSPFSGLQSTTESATNNLPHNVYSQAYDNRQEPNLDSGAPELASASGQKVNKKALVFLLGVGSMALLGTVWAYNSLFSSKQAEPDKEEVVKVPAPPVSASASPSTTPSTALPAQATTTPAIAVVQNTPMPTMESMPTPMPTPPQPMAFANQPVSNIKLATPVDPYLEQRRQPSPIVNAVGTSPSAAEANNAHGSVTLIKDADNLLVRGTYIRCVLETRIVTDIPGFASCITAEPVYSINGKKLLLSKGSKVSGNYQISQVDGPRIAVIWDRLITPNGYDVKLNSPGVDAMGAAGHIGDYKSHWPSRIGSALLISLISDTFKYGAAQYGPKGTVSTSTSTTSSPYESTTAQTISQSANDAIKNAAKRPATVTINQGTILNIYVSRDIDFSGVLAR